MSVNILSITPGSYAQRYEIKPGEKLFAINGHEIYDVLDYRFYQADSDVELTIIDEHENKRTVRFCKGEYDEIGLEFKTYLMDKQHSCRNKCIFCFIDQLPKGLRESLYFKDDDSRLSFLFGNYITLTNLSEHEISRITSMHISPINVSVHTTDPGLRVKMMGNRFAGDSLALLKRFADAGIVINCQIVACPGINDGDQLIKTLQDLKKLAPQVASIAVVPVGLTKYREGLYEIKPYDAKSASDVIDIVEEFSDECLQQSGSRIVYAADEFYLKAGRPIHDVQYYEDFAQLENGVGGIALLRDEFELALESEMPSQICRRVSIACGTAIKPYIEELVQSLKEKFPFVDCNVYAIENVFFGEQINVSGLVTGQDLLSQLKNKDLGSTLLIPAVMLRRECDVFLDDVSIDQVRDELKISVEVVATDGGALFDAVIGVSH